jgi:hypothetical protein
MRVVLQEPRLLTQTRRRRELLRRGDDACRQAQLAQPRALVGGRRADLAWASHKRFVPWDGSNDDAKSGGANGRNTQADWRGKRRTNDTHASTPDARLFRKSRSTAAVMAVHGHVLMENRSGLAVGAMVTHADGVGERAAALAMPGSHSKTVAYRAYDTRDFVQACRNRLVTPHVASNDMRIGGSAIDGRTTRHPGYAISQTIRKRIEEHFGWAKTIGRIRQTVYRGIKRVDQHFKPTIKASNIVRMARMLRAVPQGAAR